MKKKNINKQMLVIGIVIFLAVVSLSGCTTNQNTGSTTSNVLEKFIGTWTGNKETSMLGGRGNVSITQLTFTENITEETLTSNERTFTMNYTYSVQGNKLILEPKFTGGGRFSGGQSYNRTRQYNVTRPNGTWNSTRLPPGSGQPSGGQRPSMSISFDYSFNEGYTVLYLDGSQFTKIQ